jgi:hypothetical protein
VLALDRREWKVAIHVSKPWFRFLLFYCLFLLFFLFTFCLFTLFYLFFYCPSFFASFSPLFCLWLLWVSSLSYPDLPGTNRLDCCCWLKAYQSSHFIDNIWKNVVQSNGIHFQKGWSTNTYCIQAGFISKDSSKVQKQWNTNLIHGSASWKELPSNWII